MVLEKINVGSFPDSGDGDKLRNAFIKVNNNQTTIVGDVNNLYDLVDGKVSKVVGETLTPNKFTDAYKSKVDLSESITGAQAKADAAESNAITHTNNREAILQADINTRALISETGYQLTADQANATLHLKDKAGNTISTLNVGFLNNEGTTLFYNDATEEIELKDEAGNVISKFPASVLLTNVGKGLNLVGSSLELKDSTNSTLSTVNLSIDNIENLQDVLDTKESIINVDNKVAGAEENAINFAKAYGLGTFAPIYVGDLNDIDETSFKYAGDDSTSKPSTLNGWVITQSLNNLHSVQTFINSGTTFGHSIRVKSSGIWGEWIGMETIAGAQNKADVAENNAKSYADSGLSNKVDKVVGETLTPNKFTDTYKIKLDNSESVSGAQTKANTAEQNAKDYADVGDADLQAQIDNFSNINKTDDETIGGIKTFTNNTIFESNIDVSGVISEGGVLLSDKYETPVNSQTKATTAENNAKAYADSGLSTKVDKVVGETLTPNKFTDAYKSKVDSSESITGSQLKADTAEQNAKDYADVGDADLQTQIDAINSGDDYVNSTGDEIVNGVKTFADNTVFQSGINVTNGITEDGVLLSDKYITPNDAQVKATTAENNAKAYADSGLSTKVNKVAGKQLTTEDFSTLLKEKLESLKTDSYYQHVQGVPATTWDITHNLNKNPSVTVTDSAGTVVIGQVEYLNPNQVRLTFNAGFSGKAELN
jgi:hypothetical protein